MMPLTIVRGAAIAFAAVSQRRCARVEEATDRFLAARAELEKEIAEANRALSLAERMAIFAAAAMAGHVSASEIANAARHVRALLGPELDVAIERSRAAFEKQTKKLDEAVDRAADEHKHRSAAA